MELFKEVVLRVWRASNAPDAMVDKMKPIETIEAIYKRVHHMKKTVSDGTITAAASGQGLAPGAQALVIAPRPGALTAAAPIQPPGGTTGIAGPTNLHLANPAAGVRPAGVGSSVSQSLSNMAASVNSLRTSKEMQAKRTSDALATSKVTPPQPNAHPLGAQMHTPFNARELMWNGYQNMT